MPVKIGTDLIEIDRIVRGARAARASAIAASRRRSRTTARPGATRPRATPARFCGKEAVGKALGCGVRFTWKDIEIVGPPKPGVTLTGRTAGYAERVGMREIDVSLTHSHTMAGAACVVRLEG